MNRTMAITALKRRGCDLLAIYTLADRSRNVTELVGDLLFHIVTYICVKQNIEKEKRKKIVGQGFVFMHQLLIGWRKI